MAKSEGDCGANNIASGLLKDFQQRGWFSSPNFGDLSLIVDNCRGQNKNKHIVRFLMWLVETRVFKRIELCFLIKGHTQNACDRMLNLVKSGYHKKNLCMYNELFNTVNESE